MNLTDTPSTASTYYLFHKMAMDHNEENRVDLFKECMQQITRKQVLEFKVRKQIRMGSKLIGFNLFWYSRYELVPETFVLFIEERADHIYKHSLLLHPVAL